MARARIPVLKAWVVVLMVLTGVGWPMIGAAHPFLVDQQNPPVLPGSFVIASPFGQEFTPTLTSLDVVELLIMDSQPFDGQGSTVTVNVRQAVEPYPGTINGTLLGTSSLSLPDVYGGGTLAVTHFDFSTIALTSGATYVIEVLSTDDGFTAGVNTANTYPGGRFLRTTAVETADLVFSEGPAAAPEPPSLLLVVLGAVTLGVRRTKRRRKRTLGN